MLMTWRLKSELAVKILYVFVDCIVLWLGFYNFSVGRYLLSFRNFLGLWRNCTAKLLASLMRYGHESSVGVNWYSG